MGTIIEGIFGTFGENRGQNGDSQKKKLAKKIPPD
jgi:hypothetical protein